MLSRLAAPPGEGWGLFTWMMPGVALLRDFLFIPGGCAATGGSRRRFPKWIVLFLTAFAIRSKASLANSDPMTSRQR